RTLVAQPLLGKMCKRQFSSSGGAIMMGVACRENIQASPSSQLERLAAAAQSRLGGQVRDLRLLLKDNGLVLRGRARTYYAKQLAQHAVMRVTEQRIWANEIEVD